jgi:hypothetical protein
MVAVQTTELAHGHSAGNGFASQSDIQNQGVEFAFGFRKTAALLNQVLGQGAALT